MEVFPTVFSFVFGAIIGSFLNVVAFRFNTGKGLNGRSMCMSCGKQLYWYELVPILSFFYQNGKCTKCRSKISWQYPLVELAAGIIFVLLFIKFPPVSASTGFQTALYIVITCLLLVISIYDIKHKIIPDALAYSFALIAFIGVFIGGNTWFHIPPWWTILAGPILALPLASIWFFSKGNWMGLGDAKLVLGIGWLLGISAGVNAMILAFWIAAVISIVWLFVTYKRFKPKTEIPFGPYLILGMYIVLLFHITVIDFSVIKDLLVYYL